MLGKKGQVDFVWYYLLDLIVFIVVFMAMLNFVGNVGKSTTFEKNFLARDMSLMVDTVYSSPGKVLVNYPANTLWFAFNFDKNFVEVFEPDDNAIKIQRVSYAYMPDTRYKEKLRLLKPEKKYEKKESFIDKYLSPMSAFKSSIPRLSKEQTLRAQLCKADEEFRVGTDLSCDME